MYILYASWGCLALGLAVCHCLPAAEEIAGGPSQESQPAAYIRSLELHKLRLGQRRRPLRCCVITSEAKSPRSVLVVSNLKCQTSVSFFCLKRFDTTLGQSFHPLSLAGSFPFLSNSKDTYAGPSFRLHLKQPACLPNVE